MINGHSTDGRLQIIQSSGPGRPLHFGHFLYEVRKSNAAAFLKILISFVPKGGRM